MKERILLLVIAVICGHNVLLKAQNAYTYGKQNHYLLGQKGLIDDQGNTILHSKLYLNTSTGNGDRPHIAFFNAVQSHVWSFYIDEVSYTAHAIIQTRNKEYVAAWSTGVNAILLRFNNQGTILWFRKYSNLHAIESITEDNENNLYIGCNNIGSLPLVKLDPLGNVIWAKSFNVGSNYFFGRGLEFTSDGNIMLMGTATFVSPNSNNFITLIKLSTTGNVLWSKNFRTNLSVAATGMAVSPSNGRVMIAGYAGHPGNASTLNSLSVLADANGNYINNLEVSYIWWDQYYDVCAQEDGSFVMSGLCKPVQNCGGNGLLVKVNNNNDTLAVRTYGAPSGEGVTFTGIKFSNIYGLGVFGGGSKFSYWNGGAEAECIRPDVNLNVNCHLFPQVYNYNSYVFTQDSNLSETAFTPSFTTTHSKINDLIQAADACLQVPLSTSGIDELNNKIVNIYPNPAIDKLYVEFNSSINGSIMLCDMYGRVLNMVAINNSRKAVVDVKNYASGLYNIIIANEQGVRVARKVVID